MATFNISVNNEKRPIECNPETKLLYVLRNHLKLKGAKFGCGTGHCGACTVIVDNKPSNSCDQPIWSVVDSEIQTIELISKERDLIKYFIKNQAIQCGYCIPGIIMRVEALCNDLGSVSEELILRELSERHLCRCGTHTRIIKSIREYFLSISKPNLR